MSNVCNPLQPTLAMFPRIEFERLVRETWAERHARGFTCWGQLVAMLFCQLGQRPFALGDLWWASQL